MTTLGIVLVALLLGGAAIATLTYLVRRFIDVRAQRLITCPETKDAAVVRLDARRAAVASFAGRRDFRLSECTRWPERADCEQACLKQIEAAPDDCKLRVILDDWYRGKPCAFCGKEFQSIHWVDQKPALLTLSDEHAIVEWQDIPLDQVPRALTMHVPVCWNCAGVESFRRRHPELVIDRPWKAGEREARQL